VIDHDPLVDRDLAAEAAYDEWPHKTGISTQPVKNAVKGGITSTHKKVVAPIQPINRMKTAKFRIRHHRYNLIYDTVAPDALNMRD
jgi:hypothetical protein